jgi:hypothetical protein
MADPATRRIFLNRSKSIGLVVVWLLVLPGILPAAKLFDRSAKLLDSTAKKQFIGYLNEICEWIMTTGLAGPTLQNLQEGQDSLGVRGSLGRVLVAGSELTKNNARYLEEALRWGDTFAKAQQRVVTSKGNEGGYWQDRSAKGAIDLGDISLDAMALARLHVYADGDRKEIYRQALDRYARFVIEGCNEDPAAKGRGGSHGWVLSEGDNKGAIANGYSESAVQTKPSTQATAHQVAFFSATYAVSKNGQYREVAGNAARWILKMRRAIGDFPDLRDGQESEEWPLQTITSCSQGLLAAFHLLDDTALNQEMGKQLETTVRWLGRTQDDWGAWGEGPDEHRSAGAAALMAWFYLNVKADETIPQELEKFWKIVLNPVHSQSFGVEKQGLPSGQVGLVIAEMIKPGITFKKM